VAYAPGDKFLLNTTQNAVYIIGIAIGNGIYT
jgi:hypothetical protein